MSNNNVNNNENNERKSELRIYRDLEDYLGYDEVPLEMYDKYEVDNMIAELTKKLDLYKRGFKEDDKINAYLYVELRHQKYKRCLAMAEKCDARYDEEDAKVNGHAASWEYISKEMKYWERWRNRWLAIAEKFKEVQ